MKPTAYLINAARGDVVETNDLYEAIKNRRIAGAAVDVYEIEPPVGNPLLTLPNCVVTPHVGSRTSESVERQAGAAVTNLIHAMRGEKPLAQVNPEVPITKHV